MDKTLYGFARNQYAYSDKDSFVRKSMTNKKTVLVLEDNDFVRLQIVKFLQGGDYDVIESTNVEDGYAQLQSKRDSIECALVDVRMEPEDGFAFINKMQANGIDIATILVTGDQSHDILAKASNLGVASVLMKPVIKDRLLKMVERAIEMKARTA